MANGEYEDTPSPWKARFDRGMEERQKRHEAWKNSPAGQRAAADDAARRKADAARRRVDAREPGTYPIDIDGQPGYEMVCGCGTVNVAFANRVDLHLRQTCQGCRCLFIPDAPQTSVGEQLFRELAHELREPKKSR